MKNRLLPFPRRVAIALMLAITLAGCLGRTSEPTTQAITTAIPESSITETQDPTPTSAPTQPPTQSPIPKAEPVAEEGLLYRDDFTDQDSGWDKTEFDNSYIGYHEPGYYHVQVHTPNSDRVVPVPGEIFTDFTAEVEVFADADLSAAEGDYYYGVVFRRSGNLFYAFMLSSNTRDWKVIKESLTGQEILEEGSEETIQGVGELNVLRVDARGEDFFFHINGVPVAQVRDDAYTSGQVGFYVLSLDNPKAHIHFETITIREVEAPQLMCTLMVQALNLRSGPSRSFRILTALVLGDQFEPLRRTQDGLWIQVEVAGTGQVGWVANDGRYAECNVNIEDLPIKEP